ncbi:oxidoreductase [Nocardioides baekrokdamisoli]|uniref:Oxidoreductase n=1 Tax=Nocardioides baekrokdamisoli TaxID=1804624 RepID=A0A3G9IYJ8_9ACTN|nr:ferredoxin reductase [Nocardioides baekrokdamisoli]BBH16388.1 oxidoreductase [Nocardioides baekrokdamisoli]
MAVALGTRILRSNAVAALTTPHGVDRYLKHINPMWAAHEVRARIVDIHHEVDLPGEPRVATVTLQPTSTWAGHRAGQHVSVGVEVDGTRRTTRVFSVSSADSKPGERFTITVRANPDRVPSVSSFLAYEAKPGQMVHLSQAEGDFVLPDRVPERIVLISGGSGITPLMSMLRSLQRRTHRGQVTFLHYARSEDHQIFREELAGIAGNGVDIHLLHPEAGDPNLSPAYLTKLLGEYSEIPTWACGPAPLMEAVKAAYADSEALSTEYFQPPKSTGVAGGQISYARTGTESANSGETVLEQAEAAGLTPEFGCRMGICFSCTATKKSGLVRNVLTGETSELPDEDIRICVSAPEGDCVIDL